VEEYRDYRLMLLKDFVSVFKMRNQQYTHIIGLAIDPVVWPELGEDLILFDCSDWDGDDQRLASEAKERLESLGLLSTKRSISISHAEEFPASSSSAYATHELKGKDRNLPCPCGSGRKYKKCCGSPV
jgi:hypothetical protein